MTLFAFVAEAGAVLVILPADPVAVVASMGSPFDDAVAVAVCARNAEVPSFEREESCFVERARRALPRGIHAVAIRARGAELPPMSILVTRGAVRTDAGELDDAVDFLVTVGAFRGGVAPAEERPWILVRVRTDGEGRSRVAGLAVRSELSRVRVLVASHTLRPHTSESRDRAFLRMAFAAFGRRMFSGQRELRICVLEPDRSEFRGGDAVAVGAARKLPGVDVAMARRAVRRKTLVDPGRRRPTMAFLARDGGMLAGKEFREAWVCELGDLERRGRVA